MSPRQTQTAPRKTQEYSVSACVPGDLSDVELATCVEIVSDGGAVAISLDKLQNTRMLHDLLHGAHRVRRTVCFSFLLIPVRKPQVCGEWEIRIIVAAQFAAP
jgi:hypothetical protein